MSREEIAIIIIGVLIVLNIIIICVAVKCAHRVPDDFEFYDDDGNHIYYDRKLIKHKKELNDKESIKKQE